MSCCSKCRDRTPRTSAALVRERMEQAVKLVVPLTVDIGMGENWKDAKG